MWSIVLLCLLMTPVWAQKQSTNAENLSQIGFVVTTTFGEPLTGARVLLTSVGPHEPFIETSDQAGNVLFEHVPFGLYDVELTLAGFEPRRERIRVYQAELTFRLGLQLAYRHDAKYAEIVGSVTPPGRSKLERWIRLVPIFGGDLIENIVRSNGSFTLVGMAPGRYILLVLDGDRVVLTKSISVESGSQTINLSIPSRTHK